MHMFFLSYIPLHIIIVTATVVVRYQHLQALGFLIIISIRRKIPYLIHLSAVDLIPALLSLYLLDHFFDWVANVSEQFMFRIIKPGHHSWIVNQPKGIGFSPGHVDFPPEFYHLCVFCCSLFSD